MGRIKVFRGQRTRNKVTPLPHDRDNTADLERAELATRSRYKGLQKPGESSQYNDKVRTAPS